jgi:RimJ/RimL family protein N-acetyltransferase
MTIRFETPTLLTQRLQLRPVCALDVPTIQSEFGRWGVIKNMTMTVPWPYPPDGARYWVEQVVFKAYRDKSSSVWAITKRKHPEQLIGIIDVREDVGAGNRGFWMAEGCQRQGYMTEAVEAVNDWVFKHTPLVEMIVYNVASNIGSRRIKEKTGAEYLRTVVQNYHCGDADSEVWRIAKDVWMSRSKAGLS